MVYKIFSITEYNNDEGLENHRYKTQGIDKKDVKK
jgi:hypothetical protein